MNIINHSVEQLEDPFGILSGERYEFILDLVVEEDDELYSEKGLYVKVIYAIDEKGPRINQYHLYEKESDRYIDFELETEEEELIDSYCKAQLNIKE